MDSHHSSLRYRPSSGPAEQQDTGTDNVLVEETERLGITEQSTTACGRARAPQALRRAKRRRMKEERQRLKRLCSTSLFLSHDEAVAIAPPLAASIVYNGSYFHVVVLLLFFFFFLPHQLGANTSHPHQAQSTGLESKPGVLPESHLSKKIDPSAVKLA